MKNRYYALVWVATAVGALMVGTFGGWMIDLVTGNTVSTQVTGCFKHNGWNETPYAACYGNWHHRQSDGRGNTTTVASGPVAGLAVDHNAKVVDYSNGRLAGSYTGTHFASLNGDTAVVIPRTHLFLAPAGILLLLAGGAGLLLIRRSDTLDDLAGWPAAMAASTSDDPDQ